MRKKILKKAIHTLAEDTHFVRLATVTMFIHSLLFTLYIGYLLVRYGANWFGDTSFDGLFQELLQIVQANSGLIVLFIIAAIFLVIGYYLLPPIGQAAMIYYLEDKQENTSMVALSKGIYKFFPMFEYNAATSLFNFEIIIFAMLRLNNNGILGNGLIITLLIMRCLVAIFVLVFFPYARIAITLEDEDFFPAMKRSMQLAIYNMGITVQFVIISALLSVRFLVNILIVVGIPLLLVWIGMGLGLASMLFFQILFVLIVIGLILLVAYIEGIIEAFFAACRWHVYKIITTTPPTTSTSEQIENISK